METDGAAIAGPGWYDDPYRRFEFRYFNGERWTADVSIRGQRYVDHPATVEAASSTPRRGRGAALASFIIALCSAVLGWAPFMFVLAFAGAIVAAVLGVRCLRRLAHGEPGRRFAVAGLALVPVAIGSSVGGVFVTQVLVDRFVDVIDIGDYEVREEQPCTVTAGLATLRGEVTNRDDRTHDYSILVQFRTEGDVVRRATVTDRAAPDATVPWSVSAFVDDEAVTCSVSSVGNGFGGD